RMCVSAARSAPESEYVGNEASARCHSSIYRSYSATAMAHSSSLARENFMPADFVHANSGIHYRIYTEDDRIWLSFERPGDASLPECARDAPEAARFHKLLTLPCQRYASATCRNPEPILVACLCFRRGELRALSWAWRRTCQRGRHREPRQAATRSS